ncbi:MAG: Transducer protein BasT [Candidatus Methanophagaceae archaeon]|nr:MAG: Transducer protein BasT [Methanophagales archaeon]KAF5436358.1 methyl-accepting chemotaxis protein [Methanophagales archaeon]
MMVQEQKGKYKFIVIAALLGICCFLTYYSHVVLSTEIVFTHFFYIPIILAAVWWRRKGLVVAIFLASLLLFSHFLVGIETNIISDLIRASMFIVVAFVPAILSERIAKMIDSLNLIGSEVARVAREVGVEGKLDAQVEVQGVEGTWKELTDNVNLLSANLRIQVRDIAKVAAAIATGDLTQKITVDAKGEMGQLRDTINSMMDSLNALVTQVKDSANTVASSAQDIAASGTEMCTSTTQVAASVQQIAKGAQDQVEEIEAASLSLEQISKAGTEASDRADEVNAAAFVASESAQKGFETVGEAVKACQGVSDAAEETSATVEILMERAEEISTALGVITDIASQTNLLASNAAIEAARAGEAGKGFAVVVEEVHRLAEDSKKSAGEIAELVKSVQKETVSTSEAVKTIRESVIISREARAKTSAALDNITFPLKQTTNAARAISEAAAQQKTSIESVVKMVAGVSEIAEETAASSKESSVSAQELTSVMGQLTTSGHELVGIAAELHDVVERFTLSDEPVEDKPTEKALRGDKK